MPMREPGWYPNPQNPQQMLYFNGFQWTDEHGNPVGPAPVHSGRSGAKTFVYIAVAVVACITLAIGGLVLFAACAVVATQNAVESGIDQATEQLYESIPEEALIMAENSSTGLPDGTHEMTDVVTISESPGLPQPPQGGCRIAGEFTIDGTPATHTLIVPDAALCQTLSSNYPGNSATVKVTDGVATVIAAATLD